jgi:hypothetical protein
MFKITLTYEGQPLIEETFGLLHDLRAFLHHTEYQMLRHLASWEPEDPRVSMSLRSQREASVAWPRKVARMKEPYQTEKPDRTEKPKLTLV